MDGGVARWIDGWMDHGWMDLGWMDPGWMDSIIDG